jgi:hypothetical protein
MPERVSSSEVEAFLTAIKDSLGSNPSDEEVVRATKAALESVPADVQQAMLPELKRWAAVYDAVSFW